MPTDVRGFTQHGEWLVPGHNVDPVDVAAGLVMAAHLGYDDPESQMILEYALMRWQRGEEAGAERTVLGHGIDFSSWRVALAAAVTQGCRVTACCDNENRSMAGGCLSCGDPCL